MASRLVEVPASGNLPRGVVEEFITSELYIVTSGGLYGHFGKGETLEKARTEWKKAGGRKKHGNYQEQKFTSDFPFAPFDRNARESEADAWIGADGSVNWVRCKRTILK